MGCNLNIVSKITLGFAGLTMALGLAGSPAWAISEETLCLLGVLDASRGDKKVYECGECAINVVRLARRMEAEVPGFTLAKANLIYFYVPNGKLRAFQSRKGPIPWNFHAVLEYGGKVLDLDHQDGSRLHSLPDYVANMFLIPDPATETFLREVGITTLTNDQILEGVKVRAIPLVEAAHQYDASKKQQPVAFGIQFTLPEFDDFYPTTSLKNLMAEENPHHVPPIRRTLPQDGKWSFHLNSNDTMRISYTVEDVLHVLDLGSGRVALLREKEKGKDREFQDFDRVQAFLGALHAYVQANPGTRSLIEDAMRMREKRGSAH